MTSDQEKRYASSRSRAGLVFYEKSHRYKLDGEWVPGVTTIIGVLDKPAIPKWAAAQVAEYVADNPAGIDTLRDMGRGPMIQALKGIPWEKRDTAATRGSVLHDYAEQILRGEEVDVSAEHVPVIESAIEFMEDWRIEPVLVEEAVGSRADQWAGKLDLIARYRHPVTGQDGVAIFDWKSGRAIYPEAAWQLNAYAHAEFYGQNGDEHELPSCGEAFGVHIRSDDYDVTPLAFGPHIYDEFVSIRAAYDVAKRGRGDLRTPGSGHAGLIIHRSPAA